MLSSNASNLQSIRSSCDRCRLQKLKCNTNATEPADGPAPCKRCTRAKVRCVYGRRRRANRQGDLSVGSGGSGQEISMLASPSPTATSAPTSTPAALEIQPTSTSTVSEITTAYGAHSWDDLLAAAQPWDTLIFGPPNASSGTNLGQQGDMSWEWLQQDFSSDSACILDVETLDTAPNQLTDTSMIIGEDSTSGNLIASQRLVTLIADIQNRLEMLEQWPRPHDSSQSLDDYPVGAVLHLFQEFSSFAGELLNYPRKTKLTSTRCEEDVACTEMQSTNNDDELGVDTSTTLLVLYGYILLMRMYSTVFGHFQTYLERIPSGTDRNTGHGSLVGSANTRPTLQLSELPCASTVSYLGRIHTAVRMLLTTLQSVEELLGQGGGMARNLVVARLTQESVLKSGEIQDGYGGLGGKVCSVKTLLREKMGL